MIGRIVGELTAKQAPDVLVNVHGLCYEVTVPMTTYYDLPELGQLVQLSTHFVVREDAQLLFGFLNESDRNLFRLLIKVSGIGPKVGLAILSGMTASEVVKCIRQGDKAALVRLPGIGAKTAERLIMETRDKLTDDMIAAPAIAAVNNDSGESPADDPITEAEAALEALGYKKAEASRAVAKAAAGTEGSLIVEDLIRAALRSLF
ncbi:MAG: Holliday junction branch migration protein RuvA [Pseudomonadales bacterium]